MGYRYGINEVKISAEASKVPQMFEALAGAAKAQIKNNALYRIRSNKERLDNGRDYADFYISKLNAEILESEEIIKSLPNCELSREEILDNLRWSYYFDDDDSLSSMYHQSDTKDLNEEELEAIAPFVNDGSYIEASGDDFGDLFRYVFRNGAMRRIQAVISFPED
jgi:hypothetical protein